MADLRARLGMRAEKSGVVPSGSWGVKLRFLQASTEERSKEWPEETMTGSDMRERDMGHRNSSGGLLGLAWKKIFFHLSFGVVFQGRVLIPVLLENLPNWKGKSSALKKRQNINALSITLLSQYN
ncbi:hypothetical protein CR513_53687, partial [Mucuna pruriens]